MTSYNPKEESPTDADDDDELIGSEKWWRDHNDMLEVHGYRLRPRYRPGWVPSWKNTGKDPFYFEDNIISKVDYVMDAIRISDGKTVSIKRVSNQSQELAIALFLSSEGENSNSDMNHSVPVLDHFRDASLPQFAFLVMPLLRRFDDPPFFSIDEIIDFVEQTLKGLSYMHHRGVAHRDCAGLNIMLDASSMYPRGFHPVAKAMDPSGLKAAPKRRRRDVQGVKYCYIDYGISSRFSDDVKTEDRLVTGVDCQDRDVPELSADVPYDPFAVDVFILGNLYREYFLDVYSNLGLLSKLVESMTATKPKDRPSADEALTQFHELIANKSSVKLRWRVKDRRSGPVVRAILDVESIIREGAYISRKITKLPLKILRKKQS